MNQRKLKEWSFSKYQHAEILGVFLTKSKIDGRVLKGKPCWQESEKDEWFRTTPIVIYNLKSKESKKEISKDEMDDVLSIETKSGSVYYLEGSRRLGKHELNE